MICFPHGNQRRASSVDRRNVTDVALNYGCRGQFSEERRRHMEDGAKISRALIMPFPIRAGGRLNARVRAPPLRPCALGSSKNRRRRNGCERRSLRTSFGPVKRCCTAFFVSSGVPDAEMPLDFALSTSTARAAYFPSQALRHSESARKATTASVTEAHSALDLWS